MKQYISLVKKRMELKLSSSISSWKTMQGESSFCPVTFIIYLFIEGPVQFDCGRNQN